METGKWKLSALLCFTLIEVQQWRITGSVSDRYIGVGCEMTMAVQKKKKKKKGPHRHLYSNVVGVADLSSTTALQGLGRVPFPLR